MTAYFIASYRITDPAGYGSYVPAVMPTLLAADCEVLAADYASQVIEGAPGEVTVILKFASKAAAMAWYDSPRIPGDQTPSDRQQRGHGGAGRSVGPTAIGENDERFRG